MSEFFLRRRVLLTYELGRDEKEELVSYKNEKKLA